MQNKEGDKAEVFKDRNMVDYLKNTEICCFFDNDVVSLYLTKRLKIRRKAKKLF